jgi:hypothetical protein
MSGWRFESIAKPTAIRSVVGLFAADAADVALRLQIRFNRPRCDRRFGNAFSADLAILIAGRCTPKIKRDRQACERNADCPANDLPRCIYDASVTIRREHLREFKQDRASKDKDANKKCLSGIGKAKQTTHYCERKIVVEMREQASIDELLRFV